MTYGLTPTGFNSKTAQVLLAEIEAAQRASLGSDLDTSAESPLGPLNAITAEKLRELWELAGIVSAARDPRNATGDALVGVCALTGTVPSGPQAGRVVLRVTLNATTTLPSGSVASVTGDSSNRWETTADAVNNDVVPADVYVAARSTQTGALVANAGTIEDIATPVTGWTAVTNDADATPGRGTETDAELRIRREQELSRGGTTTLEAIRADLLALENDRGERLFDGCVVEHNPSAFTDAEGRPPHTIEVVVQPSAAYTADPVASGILFAALLWEVQPGGIEYYGALSATTVDSMGITRTVRSNEPDAVLVYVSLSIEVDEASYVGNAALKDALVAFGDGLSIGADVIRNRILTVVMDLEGVTDVLSLTIGVTSVSLGTANISIQPRKRASFDTSRITVVTS